MDCGNTLDIPTPFKFASWMHKLPLSVTPEVASDIRQRDLTEEARKNLGNALNKAPQLTLRDHRVDGPLMWILDVIDRQSFSCQKLTISAALLSHPDLQQSDFPNVEEISLVYPFHNPLDENSYGWLYWDRHDLLDKLVSVWNFHVPKSKGPLLWHGNGESRLPKRLKWAQMVYPLFDEDVFVPPCRKLIVAGFPKMDPDLYGQMKFTEATRSAVEVLAIESTVYDEWPLALLNQLTNVHRVEMTLGHYEVAGAFLGSVDRKSILNNVKCSRDALPATRKRRIVVACDIRLDLEYEVAEVQKFVVNVFKKEFKLEAVEFEFTSFVLG